MNVRLGVALAVAPLLTASAQTASPTLWGELRPGRHQVGFRQLLLRDPTRPRLPTATVRDAAERPGRQMQIVMWYPASAGGTQLTYGDYIATIAQRLDFAPLTAASRASAIDDYVARSAGLGGDTAGLRRALPEVLPTRVAARRQAPPAAGRFPLVIYPEWRAPAGNSILAEYLASHGFVVASIGLRGTYDEDVEYYAVRGIEALAADFAFVLVALDTIPGVDTQNAAAMGVGIAASGALALQMRSPSIRAFVSLEGGVTTEGEQRLLMRTPLFDVARVRVPMLAITAPHPSVDPIRLELYRYSDRRLVHFPTMGEFWFLDYGMLEGRVPRIIGPPPGNTILGFEWGARFVERFLSAQLRGDPDASRWLDSAAPPASTPSLFTARRRPALPAPPSIASLKRMVDSGGVGALRAFVDARVGADSQPIPMESFTSINVWLSEGRDTDGARRHDLTGVWVRLYPRSARAHASRASSALRLRDSTVARTHLREALGLLDDDPDPLLDHPSRANIRRVANALGVASPTRPNDAR
jgi:hypothetical protein